MSLSSFPRSAKSATPVIPMPLPYAPAPGRPATARRVLPAAAVEGIAAATRSPAADGDRLALRAGEVLHEPGVHEQGVWRVVEGALRLDAAGPGPERFVQIVLAGDRLGVEPLCGLPTLYRARAVTHCVLRRLQVVGESERCAVIGAALTQQWRRAADLAALRTGPVAERVRLLLLLLCAGRAEGAGGLTSVELPRLKDIAAIVDTAPETASRILSAWRQQAMLHGLEAGSVGIDRRRFATCEIPEGMSRSVRREAAASG